MKNKKNIYFLIPAVVLIWGLIGYRIVKTINPSTPDVLLHETFSVYKPPVIKEVEHYTIQANYRDPFLGTIAKKKKKKVVKPAPKPQVVFPQIVYKGMIGSEDKKVAPIFMVQINGHQALMHLKDTEQEVQLISGNKEEVILKYQSERKSFLMQQ